MKPSKIGSHPWEGAFRYVGPCSLGFSVDKAYIMLSTDLKQWKVLLQQDEDIPWRILETSRERSSRRCPHLEGPRGDVRAFGFCSNVQIQRAASVQEGFRSHLYRWKMAQHKKKHKKQKRLD